MSKYSFSVPSPHEWMKTKSFTNSQWTFTFGVSFLVQAQHASSQTLIYDNCTHYTAAQMEKEPCQKQNMDTMGILLSNKLPKNQYFNMTALSHITRIKCGLSWKEHFLIDELEEQCSLPGCQVTWPYTTSLSTVIILSLVCICSELYFWPEIVWKFLITTPPQQSYKQNSNIFCQTKITWSYHITSNPGTNSNTATISDLLLVWPNKTALLLILCKENLSQVSGFNVEYWDKKFF
jgi:hypothetical protein